MSKKLLFDQAAREKLLEGATELKKAVASTLGPRGWNAAYDRAYGEPRIVHDGVTVAKEVDPKDRFQKIAVDTLKAAAKKAENQTGDGTTTAVVLGHAILKEGYKLVASGHNAMMLRRGVEKGTEAALRYLQSISKPIKNDKQIDEVATIAAQNEDLGEIVGAAFKKLGKDAIVTVEDSNTKDTYVEYKDGMEIDKGFISPHFVTDVQLQEAAVANANIIVTDKVLNGMPDLVELFNKLTEFKVANDLVIVAGDVEGPVLSTLVLNKLQGKLNILAVKAPGHGDDQREQLEDLAVVTGARFISKDSGESFETLTQQDIGHARRVVASKDGTTFVDGHGSEEDIAARVESIRQRIEKSTTDYETERLQERLAKLTTGIAIINVGAPSTTESEELKERVIDAVGATKSALEDGVVAGGETALLRASRHLETPFDGLTEEEQAGVKLLQNALKQPFICLMENSGYDAGEKRLELDMAKSPVSDSSLGVDVIDGKVKDLLKAGIIDPVKVPMVALREAASSAAMLLTTGTLIVEEDKEKEPQVV